MVTMTREQWYRWWHMARGLARGEHHAYIVDSLMFATFRPHHHDNNAARGYGSYRPRPHIGTMSVRAYRLRLLLARNAERLARLATTQHVVVSP